MKKYLLTFCSSNYYVNQNIVPDAARQLGIFNDIFALNEYDLDEHIYNIIQNRMNIYGPRLYGYSSWRPYLILNKLNDIEYNDVLVYMDSDFIHLADNIEHKIELFDNVFNRLQINKHGIIGHYGECSNDLKYTTTKLKKCIENYLHYEFSWNQLNDYQYASGIIYIRKCDASINIINQWNDILQNNFDLVTDAHNKDNDNVDNFIENRHEQSIWSLLCKYYNIESDNIDIYKEFID